MKLENNIIVQVSYYHIVCYLRTIGPENSILFSMVSFTKHIKANTWNTPRKGVQALLCSATEMIVYSVKLMHIKITTFKKETCNILSKNDQQTVS